MLTLLALALPPVSHVAVEDLGSSVPQEAIVWVQTSDLEPLLAQGLEHPLVARVLENPLVREGMERDGFAPEKALAMAEAVLGEPPLELAHALTAGGIGMGLLPGTARQPRPFAFLAGAHGDDFEEALATVMDTLGTFGLVAPLDAGELQQIGDVEGGWKTRDGKVFLARTGSATVALATTLDDLALCTATEHRNLRVRAEARSLSARASASFGTFAWIDVDGLEEYGDIGDLRAAAQDPGAHFALGPALAHLGTAETLSLGLRIDAASIELHAFGRGARPGAAAATFPAAPASGEAGARPNAAPTPSPEEIARFELHRDLGTLLGERTEIFPPRAQPGLAEGLAGIALLVGGADAVDELFAAMHPRLTLISERVPFDERAVPDVALPAICMLARLDDPDLNGARLVSAFQSAIALRNVELSQDGRDGHRLSMALQDGVPITLAKRLPPADGDAVDISHNLAPACALVGDTVVIGSHHVLVERLVGRLVRGDLAPGIDPRAERVRLDGRALLQLLAEQRDLLIMRAVLQKGTPRSLATAQMDAAMELLRQVATFEVGSFSATDPADGLHAFARIELAR